MIKSSRKRTLEQRVSKLENQWFNYERAGEKSIKEALDDAWLTLNSVSVWLSRGVEFTENFDLEALKDELKSIIRLVKSIESML